MTGKRQVCTFFLNGLFFGVDVKLVQEVIRYQAMTSVPLAPRVVSGLLNLRGRIVTGIDLRRRLDLPDRAEGLAPMNVVVKSGDAIHSLLVDKVGDVLTVDESSWEAPPETLNVRIKELITGTYKLQDCLLMLLDVERVAQLDSAEATPRDA